MKNLRDKFVDCFGEVEAQKIESVAQEHEPDTESFKQALYICVGYGCVEVAEYRQRHGFNVGWPEFRQFVTAELELEHERL